MSLNYSHLPAWLEQNRIFRALFLIRKLFLTQSKFSHHSQYAEDISILRLFNKKYTGFFVDVGCFHPKKYNNTWRLYKRGWRGINIDIDLIKVEGFNLVRPGDINVCCAVSNVEGEVSYYSNGFYSLTSTLEVNFADSKSQTDAYINGRKTYLKKTSECKKLNTIIDATKFKNKQIDLLSVDVEAHDLDVLMSLDFARYHPKVIAVETHYRLFSEVKLSPLYQFITRQGYTLVGWCGYTLIMANGELQKELACMSDEG